MWHFRPWDRLEILRLLFSFAPLAVVGGILWYVLAEAPLPRQGVAAPVNWGRAGPFYSVDQVCEHDGQTLVHLSRYNCEPQGWSRKEADNYIASATFAAPGRVSGEGVVRLGTVSRLVHDSYHARSNLIPVRKSTVVIQIQKVWRIETNVYLCDTANGSRRKIAWLPNLIGQADYSVCAASRSGTGLLIVRPEGTTLWDPGTGQIIGKENQVLTDNCRFFVKLRGIAGDWFLSDDLQFVFCAPPTGVHHPDGSEVGDGVDISIGGVVLDYHHGLVFDRTTNQFSRFESNAPNSIYLRDIESIGGNLQLFHVYTDTDGTARITDGEGNMVERHDARSPNFETSIAGWNPFDGTIWYDIHERHQAALDENPNADHVLVVWDMNARQERRYRLKTEAIRRAIESTN